MYIHINLLIYRYLMWLSDPVYEVELLLFVLSLLVVKGLENVCSASIHFRALGNLIDRFFGSN